MSAGLEFSILDDMDAKIFPRAIFLTGADLIASVVVPSLNQDFQNLQGSIQEGKRQLALWRTYAGPAGVGQYSLRMKEPASVLARFDIHFRLPTQEEMQMDFNHFGDQVLGPIVAEASLEEKEKYKNNSTIQVWGQDCYFVGPPRIVKSVFSSAVFHGDIPEDISQFIDLVYDVAEKGKNVSFQDYYLLHANKGYLSYVVFPSKERYKKDSLVPWGSVKLEDDKKMWYIPTGSKGPVDISNAMISL